MTRSALRLASPKSPGKRVRLHIALATSRNFTTTAEHDARLVADVVLDWATRQHHNFRFTLDGIAGGVYSRGAQLIDIHDDAITFCRALSGRGQTASLNTGVPF